LITVTRFDGTELIVNADLIEFVEATPDTVLSMTTGRKVIVRESPEDVVLATLVYKHNILLGPEIVQRS
jgi:flagellar protein FlbD